LETLAGQHGKVADKTLIAGSSAVAYLAGMGDIRIYEEQKK